MSSSILTETYDVDSIFLSFAILIAQKIGSKFVVCPPQRRQQQQKDSYGVNVIPEGKVKV